MQATNLPTYFPGAHNISLEFCGKSTCLLLYFISSLKGSLKVEDLLKEKIISSENTLSATMQKTFRKDEIIFSHK